MLIYTAPGQGAQTPGFLSPWLEIPGLAEQFGAWSELAGQDLIRLGTTGSAEEITDTSVAQPLLVAAALAAAGLLGEPDAAAGHSVGELAAGAIAGVLSAADAVRLTSVRGEAMAAATAAEPTGMIAVLGGDEATVLAAIADAGLTPANINGAGQIVAGGTMAQLEAFAASPPAGARLRPLRVAGAFHTSHMAPAVEALAQAAAGTVVKDPSISAITPMSDMVSMHRSQRTGVAIWATIRSTQLAPEVTTPPSALDSSVIAGSLITVPAAAWASTSTAGAMWLV